MCKCVKLVKLFVLNYIIHSHKMDKDNYHQIFDLFNINDSLIFKYSSPGKKLSERYNA